MISTEMKNLMFDMAAKRTIFDVESDRTIQPEEANEKLLAFCREQLGVSEKSTQRDIARALKRPEGVELFEIIEEIIDRQVTTGWNENEFFNDYVETVNIADGDDKEFYAEDDIILTVTKVSGSNHDLIMQKLGLGETITIPTYYYAVKVGTDIRLFLTGRKNWSDFIDAVTTAFTKKIQADIYTAVMSASQKIPASEQYNKTGSLDKDTLDTLIEDVSAANGGVEVAILGSKTALKKLNGLTDVDWISYSQKEAVANSGILGTYEGTTLVEIPQRFADNDTATKLVDNKKLLIMPMVDNKFVKFVDYGETTIEVTEAGETMNDQQSYEVTRRMGVGVIITKYFGSYTME